MSSNTASSYTNSQSTPTPAGNYDDIIHLSRPVSSTRPRLSAAQRAAQFAPYKTITKFHDSTDDLETDSDQPETEIIFDDIQAEIAEDVFSLDDYPAYPL